MPETTNKSELTQLLYDIRKNEKQMENFVKKLEGITPNKGKDTSDFCKNYTITVFVKYCHSIDDRELMLAVCGLLHGDIFREEDMKDRIVAYWKYSHSYNDIFKNTKTPGSAKRKTSVEINRIIDYLAEDLTNAMNKNEGKIGLIEKVPNKLELYSPQEIDVAEKLPPDDSLKFNGSGIVSNDGIIPSSLSSNIYPAISDKKPQSEQLENGSGIKPKRDGFENPPSENIVSEFGTTEKLLGENSITQDRNKSVEEPPAGPDWSERIAEELSKLTKILHRICIILCIMVVAFLVTYAWQVRGPSTDNERPVTPPNNSIPSLAEASIDNSLLIEMESFSIDENDKCFPLAPGYSKELPIKEPSPPNADKRTLKVESSDEDIVWEENGYLTASGNIPEGEAKKVSITITAKNHKETIYVTVKNPVISGDVKYPVGGGDQNY